jgi:hypothetical protein
VNPVDRFLLAVVLLVDFRVSFVVCFLSAIAKHLLSAVG